MDAGTPSPACPPDLSAVIPVHECTEQREDISGKIADQLLKARADACHVGTYAVSVVVEGGATQCPLPECATDAAPCPEFTAWEAYWLEQDRTAQRCVRELLTQLGGAVEYEFGLVNGFSTHLNWQQIEQLASHPDVASIEATETPCGGVIPPA